jgi:hypothetical protein
MVASFIYRTSSTPTRMGGGIARPTYLTDRMNLLFTFSGAARNSWSSCARRYLLCLSNIRT